MVLMMDVALGAEVYIMQGHIISHKSHVMRKPVLAI